MPLTSYAENRSELRYGFHLPVQVTAEDAFDGEIAALSENISAHGILLRAEVPHCRGNHATDDNYGQCRKSLEELPAPNAGRVLRVTPCQTSGFLIAVWCVAHSG